MAIDPHDELLRLWKQRQQATADLRAAQAQTVAAPPPPPNPQRHLDVPAGASVVASFAAMKLECTLGLNKQFVGDQPNTPYPLALTPGINTLVALLFAPAATWAFEIDLTSDGAPLDSVRDQDDGNGSKPTSPVVWQIVVA